MKLEPGNKLEQELLEAAGVAPEPEPGAEPAPQAKEPATAAPADVTDVICEMENNILLKPLEYGLGLEKNFLCITEDEQKLCAAFRPDDMEVKKSAEWYWGINITLLFSKFLKWLFFNMRQKREAKQKAAEEKRKEKEEEKTR
jgi:hypothetical protein